MNMSDLDNLLERNTLKAPPGFTRQVMEKVKVYEVHKAPSTNRTYPVGLSLIAASLLTLLINLTPIMDILVKETAQPYPQQDSRVRFEVFTETIEHVTLRIDHMFSRPFLILSETMNKEEIPNE